LQVVPQSAQPLWVHFRASDDSPSYDITCRRSLAAPVREAALSYVRDAEYATQNTSHVDVVDEYVWYVLGCYEQFVNQVPGDDVRRAGLVRWIESKRKLVQGQFPDAVAVDPGARVVRAHEGP